MKPKLFSILSVLSILSGVVSAQTYGIRVAQNTNLRASYSLQSRVVETAPAGTTLAVVDSNGRWLQINQNGNELWMADWVGYTRVEDSAPTQQQTAVNIDNCCFVDRQCNSDQDWTNGYWAFQNGQCAAPVQTQTSTRALITVSSQIDNCCFVDRQCNSDQQWTDGYWAYQNNQCAAPEQSRVQTSALPAAIDPAQADNCCFIGWQCASDAEWVNGFHAYQTNQCKHPGIALEGSPGFILQMEQALDLLQSLSPKWYHYVVTGLDRIRQTPEGIIGVHVEGRHFDLSYADDLPPGRDFYGHTEYTGTMLIHEACHVHRHEAGLQPGGLEGERACVETENVALLEYARNSPEVNNNLRVLANIHRPECQWWWGEYRACYD